MAPKAVTLKDDTDLEAMLRRLALEQDEEEEDEDNDGDD